jgi:hypothetical protein
MHSRRLRLPHLAKGALAVGKMPGGALALAGNLLPVIADIADNGRVL